MLKFVMYLGCLDTKFTEKDRFFSRTTPRRKYHTMFLQTTNEKSLCGFDDEGKSINAKQSEPW